MEELKSRISFLFIVLSVFFQSASLVLIKIAATRLDNYSFNNIVHNYWYLLSFLALIFQALCWQVVLRKFELSFAYCFLSLVYLVLLICSYLIFNEPVSINNIIGVFTIGIGVIIYSLSYKDNK